MLIAGKIMGGWSGNIIRLFEYVTLIETELLEINYNRLMQATAIELTFVLIKSIKCE